MQVSANNDTNCAIVGGQKAIEFQIANSPEFFNILSSSLYANPIKAIAREIICNAWDAHVQTGVDKLIEVSLTEDEFIVQDFGPGIPKDKIQEIYGTYGLSTKKNCANQTGGFGLGCKSPFAYAENFEVTSCCEGTKTIYQMNKASESTDGKPAIIPILSLPTKETGLTVKIPIKNYSDMLDFKRAVNDVLYYSEKDSYLNGKVVHHLPKFEKFIVVRPTVNNTTTLVESTPWIKYGDVIYPLRISDEYSYYDNLIYLIEFVNRLNVHCSRIILKAKPNSLTITPSRGDLRYTLQNQEEINNLLKEVIHSIFHGSKAKLEAYAVEAIKKYKEDYSDFVYEDILYRIKNQYINQEFYEEHEIYKYFYAFMSEWRFKEYATKIWLKDSPFRRSLLLQKAKFNYSHGKDNYYPWFLKHLKRTNDKKLQKAGLDPLKFSYFYCQNIKWYSNETTLLDYSKLKTSFSLSTILSLLNPIIYVGTGTKKIKSFDPHVPKNYAFYKCAANKTRTKVIEKLKSLGYRVKEIVFEAPKKEKNSSDTEYKWTSLSTGCRPYSKAWSASRIVASFEWFKNTLESLKDMKFEAISVVNTKNQCGSWEGIPSSYVSSLVEHYNDKILIVSTKAIALKLKKKLNLLSVPEFIKKEMNKVNPTRKLRLTLKDEDILSCIKNEDKRIGAETFINICRHSKGVFHFGYNFLKKDSSLTTNTNQVIELYRIAKVLGVEKALNFYFDPSVKKFLKDVQQNNIEFLPRKFCWVNEGKLTKNEELFIRYNILKRTIK